MGNTLNQYVSIVSGDCSLLPNEFRVEVGQWGEFQINSIPDGATSLQMYVYAREIPYVTATSYYLCRGYVSNFHFAVTITPDDPTLTKGGNANGMYINPLNDQQYYYGILTIDLTSWDWTNNHLFLAEGAWVVLNWGLETDPYANGGSTATGGGGGDFDDTSDPIGIPGLPTISAVDTGFLTIYVPTLTQIQNLASFMWTNPLFDLSQWKKLFADPMDCILGLSIVPFGVPAGATKSIKVGNIDTSIYANVANNQFIEIDCGEITIKEHWGAYLDYAPYTKAELYLPFIGSHPISADEIMGKTVKIVYHIDILSGSLIAFVKCGDSVLYEFAGQCATTIPVTGRNFTEMLSNAFTIASGIGTLVSTGGMSAPQIAQTSSAAVNMTKPEMEKSGSIGGTSGLLAIQYPYITLTRPRQAIPEKQNQFIGLPSFIYEKIGDLEGYTVFNEIHLESIVASESEIAEIESYLKGGVLL